MKKLLLLTILTFSLVFVSYAQSVFTSTSYQDNFDDNVLASNAQETWWRNNWAVYTNITESGGKLNITCANADQNFSSFGLALTPPSPIDISGTRTVKMTVTNPSPTNAIMIRCDLRLIDPTFTPCFSGGNNVIEVNKNVFNMMTVPAATTTTLTFNYSAANAAYEYYNCPVFPSVHSISASAWTQVAGLIMYINPGAGENWCTATDGTCALLNGTVLIDDLIIGGAPNPDINVIKASTNTPVLTGTTTTIPNVASGAIGTAQAFTIQNLGSATLNINTISLAGPNSAEFSFTSNASTIAPGATADLYVTFSPTSVATGKVATITIDNNDADELSYVFTIAANGVNPQEINVKHGTTSGTSITSGQSIELDEAILGVPSTAESFTIENTGDVGLTIAAISLSGTNTTDFILTGLPTLPTAIAAGQSWTFTITFTPIAAGPKTATINIPNNDANEGNYTIVLTGDAVLTNTKAAHSSILSSRLYPNPVEELINLELNLKHTSEIRVTLSDLLGKEIRTLAEGSISSLNKEFSVSDLNKGLYTVTYFIDGIAAKSDLLMVK